MNRQPKAYYETPEGLNYLTYLYRDRMMTDEEVAKEIGYTRRTIINWRNSSSKINTAISLGKQYVDTQVENALLKQALQGNVTAIIFWLKNRKPKAWCERQELEVTQSVSDTASELSDYLEQRMRKEKKAKGDDEST